MGQRPEGITPSPALFPALRWIPPNHARGRVKPIPTATPASNSQGPAVGLGGRSRFAPRRQAGAAGVPSPLRARPLDPPKSSLSGGLTGLRPSVLPPAVDRRRATRYWVGDAVRGSASSDTLAGTNVPGRSSRLSDEDLGAGRYSPRTRRISGRGVPARRFSASASYDELPSSPDGFRSRLLCRGARRMLHSPA